MNTREEYLVRRLPRILAPLVIAIMVLLFWRQQRAVGAPPGRIEINQVERGASMNATSPTDVKRTGLCALHVEFCKYRGLYRQVGLPFLILGLIVRPCWLLYRLYRVRTSAHPLSLRREFLLLTFVVYLVGLATLTLTPNRSERLRAVGTAGIELTPNLATLTCVPALVPSGSNVRSFCKQNAWGNVLLFLPFGVLIALLWRELRFWKRMLIAMALSLGIELVQYLSSAWGSYRTADVNDVILNTSGACLGLLLVSLLPLRRAPLERNPEP
jgi:glycopeptide antibiotics resistance protein